MGWSDCHQICFRRIQKKLSCRYFAEKRHDSINKPELRSTKNHTTSLSDSILRIPPCVPPPLRRQHLIVMLRPQLQPRLLPRRKVVRHRNRPAARALINPVGDILPEGLRARNRRLADLLMLVDLVRAPVALDGAELLALGGALAVRGVLLDVVLDERVACPAVDGD